MMQHRLIRTFFVLFIGLGLLLTTGCGGCRDDSKTDANKKKADAEKKKQVRKNDFDSLDAVVLPGVFPRPKPMSTGDEEDDARQNKRYEEETRTRRISNQTKLGHWVSTKLSVIANNFDSSGKLSALSVNPQIKPVLIPGTNYYLQSSRPASLPKEEWKSFETMMFLPRRNARSQQTMIDYSLSSNGIELLSVPLQATSLMKPFQYHFVILSNRPEAYKYVELSNAVQISEAGTDGTKFPDFYNIVTSRNGDPVPLARQSLAWTTIAYVLWDDFAADQLDNDQQQAMLDWIHHGGQLIISGPDSLDGLQSTFISEFLPAKFQSTRNLTNQDFRELNDNWSIPVAKNPREKRELVVSDQSPLLGVNLVPHPDAEFMAGTGELVVERRVGRGRIVITAFSMDDTPFRKWRSLDSFLNSCLMRRPARTFVYSDNEMMTRFKWADNAGSIFDPLIGSTLRYLSRDLGDHGTAQTHVQITPDSEQNDLPFYYPAPQTLEGMFEVSGSAPERKRDQVWRFGGFEDDKQSGVAGWNDSSAVSNAARRTLKEAAGISPPSSKLILKLLAIYLVVLVPLNWLIFRIIGRVEWAWVAAPIIAIAGAITVVKVASLDIGFVRSNNQVGIVEAFANHSRAHVTEYSALYTSLSTEYNVELDNSAAQSIPFAANEGDRFSPAEVASRVTLNRTVGNRLEEFQVQSNSTQMLHTEYMVDLNGVFSFKQNEQGNWLLGNLTRYDLESAIVLRRTGQNGYTYAEIGSLPAGIEELELDWMPIDKDHLDRPWAKFNRIGGNPTLIRQIVANQLKDREGGMLVSNLQSEPLLADILDEFNTEVAGEIGIPKDQIQTLSIDKTQLEAVIDRIIIDDSINGGQIFLALIDNLELEIGESRLIASSDQPIGNTQFSPKSTQTNQTSLFVVHLKKDKLPIATRDTNSMADYAMNSNLDLDRILGKPDEFDNEEDD